MRDARITDLELLSEIAWAPEALEVRKAEKDASLPFKWAHRQLRALVGPRAPEQTPTRCETVGRGVRRSPERASIRSGR